MQFYAGARFYSKELARFTTTDPIPPDYLGQHFTDPYALCGNDPVNKRDPLGLAPRHDPTRTNIGGPGCNDDYGQWHPDDPFIEWTTVEPPVDPPVDPPVKLQSIAGGKGILPGSAQSRVEVSGAGAGGGRGGGGSGAAAAAVAAAAGAVVTAAARLVGSSRLASHVLSAFLKIADVYTSAGAYEALPEAIVEAGTIAAETAEVEAVIAATAAGAAGVFFGPIYYLGDLGHPRGGYDAT